jgi:hypothetical protein
MNGYPKVFNIESDQHEEHNIAEIYNWVLAPTLKLVEDYKKSLEKYPNPPCGKHDPILSGKNVAPSHCEDDMRSYR